MAVADRTWTSLDDALDGSSPRKDWHWDRKIDQTASFQMPNGRKVWIVGDRLSQYHGPSLECIGFYDRRNRAIFARRELRPPFTKDVCLRSTIGLAHELRRDYEELIAEMMESYKQLGVTILSVKDLEALFPKPTFAPIRAAGPVRQSGQ